MRKVGLAVAVLIPLAACGCGGRAAVAPAGPSAMTDTTVLTYSLPTIDGADKRLADFKGQVLLLVNVASKCGFTPQYAPLEKLYETYKDRGFRILAFPANNFGAQEPGTNPEIKAFCESTYGVTFDLFAKISVKGDDIHPLYRYLTTASPFPGEITWNFNKFLVDREGRIVARFPSKVDPLDPALTAKIEELLKGT